LRTSTTTTTTTTSTKPLHSAEGEHPLVTPHRLCTLGITKALNP